MENEMYEEMLLPGPAQPSPEALPQHVPVLSSLSDLGSIAWIIFSQG